jgi:hypothetical protein
MQRSAPTPNRCAKLTDQVDVPTETPIRIAAVLFMVNGLGFGLFTVPVARYLLEHRELPRMFGFPLFGGGFYETFGIERFVVLLVAFLLVSILEVVAGGLLWNGERSGGILALALLPIGAVFWLGFALPLPPLSALLRTALIVLNWSALRP